MAGRTSGTPTRTRRGHENSLTQILLCREIGEISIGIQRRSKAPIEFAIKGLDTPNKLGEGSLHASFSHAFTSKNCREQDLIKFNLRDPIHQG